MKKKFTSRDSNMESLAHHAGPLPLRPSGRLTIEKTFRYINNKLLKKFEALFLGTGGLCGPMA